MAGFYGVAKQSTSKGEVYFGIVEYLEMSESETAWTEDFQVPKESSLKDLEETLEYMLRAVRNAKDGIETVLDNGEEED